MLVAGWRTMKLQPEMTGLSIVRAYMQSSILVNDFTMAAMYALSASSIQRLLKEEAADRRRFAAIFHMQG
jgi:hypothetical protein